MKIKDLIEELKRLDPEGRAFVTIEGKYGVRVTKKVAAVESRRAGHDAVIVADT